MVLYRGPPPIAFNLDVFTFKVLPFRVDVYPYRAASDVLFCTLILNCWDGYTEVVFRLFSVLLPLDVEASCF